MMPFGVTRKPLLSPDDTARIHALAKRILAEIGLEVCDPGALDNLRRCGFRVQGKRIFPESDVVDAYVEMMRGWLDASKPGPRDSEPQRDVPITLSVSSYSLYVHDIDTDTVVPCTSSRLAQMCKLVDSFAEEGVVNAPPGTPTEVHPDLQPLAQYRIAANMARQGATPVDPTSPRTVMHLLDMADVMEQPIRHLPIYVPTPLRYGGDSLAVVMTCLDRLESISISSMPSTGASAPLQPFGALALAAAEVIGSAIATHELTGKPAYFRVEIYPFDLRAESMVFGTPENVRLQMLSHDMNRFYGWPWAPAPNNIHVMAKRPDDQSAAEKAAIMALRASLGATHFSCAGTLSMDEIFSPEQLVLDCEIRDWVANVTKGAPLGTYEVAGGSMDGWLAEIRSGIDGGFMALDSTLDYYRSHTWFPGRFERRAIGPWLADGRPRLSERLRDEVRWRIARHDYELDADRRDALDRIYESARSALDS